MYVRWLIYTRDTTDLYVGHDLFRYGKIEGDDVSQLVRFAVWICIWDDWFIRVTWLNYMRDMDMTYFDRGKSKAMMLVHCLGFLYAYACDMTYSYVRHDSLISGTGLISKRKKPKAIMLVYCLGVLYGYVCEMTYSCLWHDSFVRGTWLIHTCDMM